MKYTNQGQFSTQQMSIDETITELDDVIGISVNILSTLDIPEHAAKEIGMILLNLKEAKSYMKFP